MELKHRQNIISIRNNTSFNRTFMELKQGKTDKEQAQNIVLIAPLWN